jgi:pyruvate/2-oxoglutarate dehydrogenase complex dihydrolipoamide acyltransferase (E2) component
MPEIVIQAVGVAMEEALLTRWLKQPGDTIAVDDIVAEIDTDKASMDVTSPYAGTLGAHLVAEGEVVPVGAAIVLVLDGSERPGDSPTETAAPEASSQNGAAAEPPPSDGISKTLDEGAPTPHRLSPRARRLAAQAQQSAPAQAQESAASPEPNPTGGSRFRELIATKVAESWREIPHFTVSREVNAGPLQRRLDLLRSDALDPRPTLTDLLLVALARALDHDGPVDLGLAVATEHGVVMPVVRDVLGRTPAGLASARQSAVERARAGRLNQDDLSATPTSTLSNLGAFGVDRFTGIVASGQTSLLTVGRIRPRVVPDETREITVQMMFDATLNADHRTVDGADAARVLAAFAEAVETMDLTTEKGS